jgi:hypothetical protein
MVSAEARGARKITSAKTAIANLKNPEARKR